MKKQIAKKSFSKRRTILIAAIIMVSLAMGFIVFNTTRTYPLGNDNQVVYLGKKDGGIYIPGVSWSYNSDEYYYGTDMSAVELAGYFGAEIADVTDESSDSPLYDFKMKDGKNVPIQFYKEKGSTYASPPDWARATSKRYFFYILDDYYNPLLKHDQ